MTIETGYSAEQKPLHSLLSPQKISLLSEIGSFIESCVRDSVEEEAGALGTDLFFQKAEIQSLRTEVTELKSELTELRKQFADLIIRQTKTNEDSEKKSDFRVKDDREAILSEIKRLYLKGFSHAKIATYLNKTKVPTLSGRGKWHRSAVSKIIREKISEI
ncbi:DNA-binding domain-containing protein [Desulfonema magnum]|uniref:DNA-binding domain-containing protein n=1 Tax=Desulfonema magnum TaxID=45655 RepID=A0A975BNH8_9BACT|nr:DNA-binding domain-containing protein [Desulfonema magnum]